MTLLVVLGFVVIATILAALYLSLRSARGGDRESAFGADGASARSRQARGGSRPGQAGGGLADRLRAMTGRGGSGAGRSGDPRDRDYGDARARSRARGDDFDRDDLVTAGTGPREMTRVAGSRSPGSRPAGDFRRGRDGGFRGDETGPAFRPGYGRGEAGYDGYDGAADTKLSTPAGGSYGGTGRRGYGGGPSSGHGGRGGPPLTSNPAAPSFTPAEPSFTPAPTGPSFTPVPASTANGTGAHGRSGPDRGGPDRGGSARGGRGTSRGGRGDRDHAGGFSGGDADATRVGYGPGGGPGGGLGGDGFPDGFGGDRSGGDRSGGGPDDRRAGAPRRGRRSGASPADRYPEFEAEGTGPNRGYGLDDRTDPAMRTDSQFAPAPDPRRGADADENGGEGHMGRRRIGGKLQRPNLRLHREKPDWDNDPWPTEEENGGVSDEQFWADINTDKPLATTARTAQATSGSDQPAWADDFGAQAPAEPADRPAPARGRRGRRREEDQQPGTEPNPYRQMDNTGPGQRRHGRDEPSRRSRGAEEDPLTSASFSRNARDASDSRSYRAARESRRGGSHGRPESTMADTQAMMPDTQRFSSAGAGPSAPDPLTDPLSPGPRSSGGPGTGPRGIRPGGDLPPSGPRDRYGDGGYRGGARPADPYADRTGGYEQPGRGSRHAASPGGRPPAPSNGQRRARPALPGPGPSSPPTSSGPMPPRPRPGSGPATGGRRDGGDPGYRTQPNGPVGSNGAGPLGPGGQRGYGGTGDSPYQPRSGGYPGEYQNGRRPSGRENGHRRPDDYDDPYGNTGNGRY